MNKQTKAPEVPRKVVKLRPPKRTLPLVVARPTATEQEADTKPSFRDVLNNYPLSEAGESDELTKFCEANAVAKIYGVELRWLAIELRDFEKRKASLVRPVRQVLAGFEQIEALATQLLELLEAMPEHNERAHLEWSLQAVGMPLPMLTEQWLNNNPQDADDLAAFGRVVRPLRVETLAGTLQTLARGAKHAQDVVTTDGKTGGRAAVTRDYASYVYQIAFTCCCLKITPGRGGKFEELCNAIFAVAKVHAKPATAIRYYMQHHYQEAKGEGLAC